MTPQPPIELENSIFSRFMAGQGTNNKNGSQDTIAKLLELYSHPTDNLSNSMLFNRAAEFATDYAFLAPQRLFLKVASAKERKQDVWAYSFQQHLPSSPNFLGGEYSPGSFPSALIPLPFEQHSTPVTSTTSTWGSPRSPLKSSSRRCKISTSHL
jgi:hypothetical protein